MEQNKTQRELLDGLVGSGVINESQAQDILSAPRWSFSVRELVSYLGAMIIAAGVVRLLAYALKDASVGTIAIALYVLSVVLGFASWKLSSGSEVKRRLAEVFELGALGAAAGGTGIVLDQADMRGEWIGLLLTGAIAVWGLARCRTARFAGTVALSVGTVGVAISLSAVIDVENQFLNGGLLFAAGVILVGAGLTHIGSQQLARAVGSLFIIIGSMTIGSAEDWSRPASILTGAALFAAGTMLLAPEMLVAGAFCVVAGVVMTVMEWVDNEMAQGLVIIATGLVVLGALSVQMRRAVNRPAPGARVA
jgi:hypothetical protein